MQETSPLVSVIVPVYNVERYLDQALESIERQTLHDMEIICVNDGSTDSSLAIMERHASCDERIRIVNKPNGGYGSACNRGMEEACGTWITIVEPDDWIDAAMYEDMIGFANSFDTPLDIVKTPYWRVIDPDTPEQHLLNCSYKGRIRPAHQPFNLADVGTEHLLIHHPSIWSALYHTRFLSEKDIRFMEIPGAGWADNPFLVETLCQASAIAYLDRAYYYYREETPEKTASFARNQATVPFERWHDMMDVLERLNVHNKAVLNAQYRRGFTYLDYVASEIEADDERVRGIMMRMFNRMDDNLVLSEPHISPTWKKRYIDMKGLPARRIGKLPYAATLLGAGVYSLRNVGVAEAVKLVGAVARNNKTAESVGADDNADMGELAENAGGQSDAGVEFKTTLSVVIPVYNSERYLGACLASLANQTYRDFEIVCVDDGSSDKSRALLDKWAARDERIRIVSQSNSGPSSARNTGIREASGDYVCFLDSDDLFERTACQRILEIAENLACDCVVYGWSCFPPADANDWLRERTHVSNAFYPQFDPALIFDEMTHPFLRVATRRSLLLENGIFFDEALRVGEDSAFLFALYPRAKGVKLISDKLYRYRLPHEGSITSVARDGSAGKCADDLSMMVSLFEDWSDAGFLKPYAARLIHWQISFFLYTALRQPESMRNLLVQATKELWLAHFTGGELRALPLPTHDFKLIDIVMSAQGDQLSMGEREVKRLMLEWRVAEYGAFDLVKTAASRILPD